MPTEGSKPAPPSGDKRWRIVEATMRRVGYDPSGLIETLHSVQDTFGYLDDASLRFVAYSLNVPLSRAMGVATFYHYFTLKPPGKHTCVVCLGTACYIKGSSAILDAVKEKLRVGVGETTPDGRVSLLTARCLGACGIAPTVVYDGEVAAHQTREDALKRTNDWMKEDA